MNNKYKSYITLLILVVLFLFGISLNQNKNTTKKNDTTSNSEKGTIEDTMLDQDYKTNEYTKITPKEAKEMMDTLSSEDFIILDVRTEEEHNDGHIEGAILIPNTELKELAVGLIPNKETTLFVYCRSGNRSASAAKDLLDMGFTSVYDFGGIMDWQYDIVD